MPAQQPPLTLLAGLSDFAQSTDVRSSISGILDFTGANTSYEIDLRTAVDNAVFTTMRTLFVNNVTNPNPITFLIGVSQQPITVPPYSVGYYKIVTQNSNTKFIASSVGGATSGSYFSVLNFDVSLQVWIVAPSGAGTLINAPDGSIATLGSKADAAVTNPASSASLIALTKGLLTALNSLDAGTPQALGQTTMANSMPVVLASDQTAVATKAADGAFVTVGTTTDAAVTNPATAGTVISFLKGLASLLGGALTVVGNVAAGTADAGNPIKGGAVYNAVTPSYVSGNRTDLQAGPRGKLVVATGASASGSDNFSNSSLAGFSADVDPLFTVRLGAVAPSIFNGVGWDRQRKPNLFARIASSSASGNPAFLKASAGDVHKFWGLNGAAITYLQIYNKASAPVIGTDTPVLTYAIAALAPFNIDIPNGGAYLSTGIAYAFTTDAAATTGAAAAAVTSVAIFGA